ncbi:MAG TPA: PEP-utilizing enzyme [Gaiellaceae bacterium]|nr:PEP-utilizing enzyme [Gaiellaceae bacterium]
MTTWLPDPSHYPEQMTPLSATVWFEALGNGLHEAMRELRGPFGGFRSRTDLGWAYECVLPPEWEHEPEGVRAAALALGETWEERYRPRVWEITRELWDQRPELPAPPEAAALFDRMWELVQEQWTIHFLTVVPAQIAAEIFNDRYVELFGAGDPLAPYRLLERAAAERGDDEIDQLAGRARELRVDHLLREHAPEHALARLAELASGRVWLDELRAYLHPLGGAAGRVRWHELSLPREIEFPALTLEAVRLRLDREPPPVLPPPHVPEPLAELFSPVAAAYRLKETHSYHIDYPGLLATRDVLRAFGRRLAAEGLVADVDDVWMLERTELREALVAPGRGLRALVVARRAELEQGLRDGPKPYLGDPPAETERHLALEKFYGSAGASLAGAGASPGIGEGIARVVSSIGDFGRVEPGDVLVAATTTPAWTPLFDSLAALVTETGGILSHAAIVAREYGIPAVVGAAGAMSAIPDGARVRVDGATGEITIL